MMWLGYDFADWALGKTQWVDDDNVTETIDPTWRMAHPYLGCNNDRMSHAPKGVLGIRMDGVDDLSFHNVEVYDIYEVGTMGSELCGDYWDEQSQYFDGGGHFLQKTPYYYGFTGNRVHGIFMDWTEVTISGNLEIYNLQSTSGLVRGLAVYVGSEVTIADDATVSISELAAGTALGDVD